MRCACLSTGTTLRLLLPIGAHYSTPQQFLSPVYRSHGLQKELQVPEGNVMSIYTYKIATLRFTD